MLSPLDQEILELTRKYGEQFDEHMYHVRSATEVNFKLKKVDLADVVPMFYPLERRDTLIVGLNPSFNKTEKDALTRKGLISRKALLNVELKKQCEIISQLKTYQHGLMFGPNVHSYFKKIHKLLDNNSKDEKYFPETWTHFDLFPFRCSKSTPVSMLLRPRSDFDTLVLKARKQLEHVLPGYKKVIILNNTVSEIFRNKEHFSFKEILHLDGKASKYGLYLQIDGETKQKIFLYKQPLTYKKDLVHFELFKEFLKKHS